MPNSVRTQQTFGKMSFYSICLCSGSLNCSLLLSSRHERSLTSLRQDS